MLDKFSYNETVQMVVIKQIGRKNNCNYQAKLVKKLEGSMLAAARISNEVFGPLIAQVTSTTDSYAFAQNDEKGTIFVPGDAFDAKIVKNVGRYVNTSNQLVLKIKEQIERKGCKWVAVEAVKHFVVEENEEKEAVATGEVKISWGVVVEVDEMEAHVLDEKNGILVTCPILKYTGGADDSPSARALNDVISIDNHVMFKAMLINGRYDAVEWKKIADSHELVMPKKVNTSDSYAQTPACLVTIMFRKLLQNHPEDMDRYSSILDQLPPSALPDCYFSRENCTE